MNTSKHRNRGISLIEVMIAFAVTSVLMAFTMPAHIDLAIKAGVDSGLSLAGPFQEVSIESCASSAAEAVDSPDAGYSHVPADSSATQTESCP